MKNLPIRLNQDYFNYLIKDSNIIQSKIFQEYIIEEPITINKPYLILQNGIFIQSYGNPGTDISGNTPAFNIKAKGVFISACHLIGHDGRVGSPGDTKNNTSNALEINNSDFTIVDSILENWNKWAIYIRDPNNIMITNNLIKNSRLEGYGYGIWNGHYGGLVIDNYHNTIIFKNIFKGCRSAIDGSSIPSNRMISHNIFTPEQTHSVITSHGNNLGNAGNIIKVENNIIMCKNQRSIVLNDASSLLLIENNYTRDIWYRDTLTDTVNTSSVKISNNKNSKPVLSFCIEADGSYPYNYDYVKAYVRIYGESNYIYYKPLIAKGWQEHYVSINDTLSDKSIIEIGLIFPYDVIIDDTFTVYITNIKLELCDYTINNGSFDNEFIGWRQKPNSLGTEVQSDNYFGSGYSYKWQQKAGGKIKAGNSYIYTMIQKIKL